MDIGQKIKDLRLLNSLTQEELADRCELTKGYISQLENDLTSPSISTLEDILTSLGSGLAEFFLDEGHKDALVFKKQDYFEKQTDLYSLSWLVPTAQKNAMEPILITLLPNASSDRDLPHEGEEFGYVLSGAVTLIVGKQRNTVKSGESFYFKANREHYIQNASDKQTAAVLWVSSPPSF